MAFKLGILPSESSDALMPSNCLLISSSVVSNAFNNFSNDPSDLMASYLKLTNFWLSGNYILIFCKSFRLSSIWEALSAILFPSSSVRVKIFGNIDYSKNVKIVSSSSFSFWYLSSNVGVTKSLTKVATVLSELLTWELIAMSFKNTSTTVAWFEYRFKNLKATFLQSCSCECLRTAMF